MKRRGFFFFIGFVAFVMVSVYSQAFAEWEENLTIHFIDVGQADATVLLCGGEVLMIDGGNPSDSSLVFSYLRNTLGIDHIDYMIATHPHDDHIGGLAAALNACSVGVLYSPISKYDSESFEHLLKYADKHNLSITVPQAGDEFKLGNATVQIISPIKHYGNINDMSISVRITHGSNSFLFTGDAEWDAEHDMVNSEFFLKSTLLHVGHHGSNTSSSYVFLREVMPEYAVISVGIDNPYDHPSENTLSRLQDTGARIFRTDIHGDIICTSDGVSIQFETEHIADEYSTPIGEPIWKW